MKVEEGKYSIAELVDWYRRRDLVVNKEYQRGGGLWPTPAKSYFIDTILREFPFPKVYFHERVDMSTKRPRREIVDGQQRISTIVDFVDDVFALGTNAGNLQGKRFSDLTSPTKLLNLYRKYDTDFPDRDMMNERINGAFDVVLTQLSELRDTYLTRPHIFHSLICALIYNRFGLPNAETMLGLAPVGIYMASKDQVVNGLKRLALAHEEKETSEFREYGARRS